MTAPTTSGEIARWVSTLQTGDTYQIAQLSRQIAESSANVDTKFTFKVYDKFWRQQGDVTGWVMEGTGTDPRNNVPTARLVIKASCPFWHNFAQCRTTMVGLTVETAGQRYAFYVKTFTRKYEKGELTGIVELKGIWDVLNYLIIWPSWYLPIETQPFSHAVFIWGLQTVLESMVAECALRIQSGLWDFVNNAGSLNPDVRTWFSGLLAAFNALASGGLNGLARILRTPVYVKRTNPFLDTSGLVARTVRMESCATVITDITRAYGVDTRMDLWLPGDPQPDEWANLDQPTYVFSTVDRSQITGPTGTVLDSVLRTVVDLEGSLFGGLLDPFLNPSGPNPALPEGAFTAEVLGVDFVSPYAIVVVPDAGKDAAIISAEISDHTPEGWQHIIGGRSPKWLNDLMNATTAWLIDSLSILIGFTGIPSDILAGFLNNSFLAFQLIQHYERRNEVGPYHPGIETFTATSSAPYNIETVFGFINKLWDTKGYTAAIVKINVFGPKAQYALGRDIFKGGLMSVVFDSRRLMLTDYIENVTWRITPTERELIVQLGDGRRDEAPLAKQQRFISALFESYNVLTLAPQSG
jgi:hypothetical protein